MAASLRLVVAAGEMTENLPSVITELEPAGCEASAAVPADGKKLAGCRGVPIASLLPTGIDTLTQPTAVITAVDGLVTSPISLTDLRLGVLVHSCSDSSPLPLEMGGPLRVWFPDGLAVRSIHPN